MLEDVSQIDNLERSIIELESLLYITELKVTVTITGNMTRKMVRERYFVWTEINSYQTKV